MKIKTTMKYHLKPSELLSLRKKKQSQIANVEEDVKKRNYFTRLVRISIGATALENSMEVP